MILKYTEWKRMYEQKTGAPKIEYVKLKDYDCSGFFPANMITPDPSKYIPVIDALQAEISDLIDKKYTPGDLMITVESGASSTPATKCLPQGISKPDHDYNGLASEKKWIQVKPGECPTSQRVEGGNEFLANARGNKLIEVIKNELIKRGVDANDIIFKFSGGVVSTSPDPKGQYVKASISAILQKEEVPVVEYNYYIEGPGISNTPGVTQLLMTDSKVFGDKKLNAKRDFTLKQAQALANAVAEKAKRQITVIENPNVDPKSVKYDYYGKYSAYIEVKNTASINKDNSLPGVYQFRFKDHDTWKKELDFLKNYRSDPPQLAEDAAHTYGAAGWAGRFPGIPKTDRKTI